MEQTEIHRFMGVLLKFERKVAGMLKICVSALKSAGWNFVKFDKVKRNTLYVYFLTRQGAASPDVDSIHIVI